MQQTCANPWCSQPFTVTEDDLAFLEKVSPVFNGKKELIPPPTLCPECRWQRRIAYRNERHLYHRKCSASGKQIISNFSTDKPFPVYMQDIWWGDTWDGSECAQSINPALPVMQQWITLKNRVPHIALNVINSENSEYCNYMGNVKDCYLIFGSVYCESCLYGSPYYSRHCIDSLVIRECEYCYECVDCRKLYHCLYCQDCHSSHDLLFCYDMQGCSDCIGCAGLRNKQYCIFNEQLSAQEYQRRRSELQIDRSDVLQLLRGRLLQLQQSVPHRFMQSGQVEYVSGNYVYESRHVLDAYYADRCQNCRFVGQVVDQKDCYDVNFTEENECCYEYIGSYQNFNLVFSLFCNKVYNGIYCDNCINCKDVFACAGLKNRQYCLFNQQYTKEEYESLVPQLIARMREEGMWGEFFPVHLSPFGYNETIAQEYFPLTKKEVLERGWQWHEEENMSNQYLGPDYDIPAHIADVPEDITKQILKCEVTGKPYKIIPQELKFYRDMGIPIPRKCPDQRHKERMALRNPRKLWNRQCQKCGKDIQTTYAPDRPEIVYCEECYLASVY